MRAYVNATAGLNVRSEPRIAKNILYALPYGTAVDVDRIVVGEWSKLNNVTGDRYCYGSFLRKTATGEVFTPPISYTQINLHGSAGGWSPTDQEQATLLANRVNAVLIPTYNPQVASDMISKFRNAGVQHFILRATAPFIAPVVNGDIVRAAKVWAEAAIARLKPFTNVLGTRGTMIQVHNEPNLSDEGLYTGWRTASEFSAWSTVVSSQIRDALEGVKLGFAPMSPGFAIPSRRITESVFIAACFNAIKASDWIAVHAYYGRSDASDLIIPLTMWRGFAQGKPIVCTEAGPSIGKQITIDGAQRMFKMFAAAKIPTFGWILGATQAQDFIGQGWAENHIVLPTFNHF